jgi:hypothetical protein
MQHFLQIRSYNDDFFRKKIKLLSRVPVYDDSLIKETREKTFYFCSKVFKNLNEFPFIYYTAGVTEAINFLLMCQQTTSLKNDYRYVFSLPTVNTNSDINTMYFSYPFAGDGKFKSIPENKKIILDCSYMFASNLNSVDFIPNNVEYVLFGISKSHNLYDLRSGWIFSRKKILPLHFCQYEFNYNGVIHSLIIDSIVDKDSNFLYKKYKTKFSKLYKDNNLVENDVNLFGVSSEGKKIPYYILK